MPKRKLTYALSAILLTMSLSVFSNAKVPSLSITALTDPLLLIPKNEERLINYKLTNLSNKSYHLTMKPSSGIIQEVGKKNACAEGMIHLEPGQSCILNLQVRANETLAANNLGPVLCDYDESNLTNGQCFEPRVEEQIRVKELNPNQASFSAEIKLPQELTKKGFIAEHFKRCFASAANCTVILFVGSSAGAHIVITNTSSVTIKDLTAHNLPRGVTANTCLTTGPGKTCDLQFTLASQATHNLGTTVTIRGSNTASSTITMQVLAVGDRYEGNQLFQLPYTSTNSSALYYTALAADGASGEQVWGFEASDSCASGSVVPSIGPLQQLYLASNCADGPIGGFNCSMRPSFYWSTTRPNQNDFNVVNFENGGSVGEWATDAFAFVRCVKSYTLN